MYIIEQYSYFSSFSESIKPYVPLILVFLSGLGFSFQTLIIKLLEENGFSGSLQCVFSRGLMQFIICGTFVYLNRERTYGCSPRIFGETSKVRAIMFARGFFGFGGIAFSFLSVEKMSVGDSTVLVMLSPLFASILGYFALGEPWRLPEFVGTIISLIGATLVARPPFLFGGNSADPVGVTYALIAAVSAGIAYILVRVLGTTSKMPWQNVCVAQSICQMAFSIPTLYALGQKLTFYMTVYDVILIAVGGFIGAWSQIAMTIGMQREKSATATAMRMSDVVFGFIWQVMFTNDSASVLSIIGAILVTSSILIIVIFKPVNKVDESQKQYSNISIVDSSDHNVMNPIVLDDDNSIELTGFSKPSDIITRWTKTFKDILNNSEPFVIVPTINISNYIITTQNDNISSQSSHNLTSQSSHESNIDIENEDSLQEVKLYSS